MSTDTAFTGSIPELYDRCLGPMLFEPFALELASRFEGFTGDILETAAGTGRVTRALAEAAPRSRITATDLNGAMLEKARAVVPARNVEWREADAQALPFTDTSYDAVVCQFGVMFYPDKARGYAEARRVLRRGGRYVFSVWDELEANDLSLIAHEALAAEFPDDPPNFLRRTPFGHADRAAIEAGVTAAGFSGVAIDTVRLATPAGSAHAAAQGLCMGSPLRAEIEERAGPDGLEAVTRRAAEALQARFGKGPITGAMGQALVVTATA